MGEHNGKKVSVLSIRTFLLSMDFFAHHFAVLSIVYPFTSNSIQKSFDQMFEYL